VIIALFLLNILFIAHGLCTLFWLLFAWQDNDQISKEKTPHSFEPPQLSFTALLPARHETNVIKDTLLSVTGIDYPAHLTEVLVICKSDDLETIAAAQAVIDDYQLSQCRLITFDDTRINKPHALNLGLVHAKHEVIGVFDAEDQPHPRIYQIVNTLMTQRHLDILQSGVQLMNHRSHWFSTFNVLEYFFWFKSTMHYFAKKKVIPLGGNTVFFRKQLLRTIDGWDENCLTEDADVGIRLSSHGAKIGVTYDEATVTREETPSSVSHFIKQRTRWNQGFLEIFAKGDWLHLATFSQKALSAYILLTPYIQLLFFVFIIISLLMMLTTSLPIALVLFMMIPLMLVILQLIVFMIGLYLFCKAYQEPFRLWYPLKIVVTFLPYQCLLGLSSLRALYRTVRQNTSWEKTAHFNAHRQSVPLIEIKELGAEA